MLKLHNTLTGTKDTFTPQDPARVTLYTCGPTVYSEPHIGNWVAFMRWDILVRVLRANNYTVERVMNITDVGHLVSDEDEGEDKMVKGARREGISEWEVAERYTNRFLEGMNALNMLPPEHVTKATEHIDIQLDLVKRLEKKGYTYVLDDGVYFDTSKFPTYADFAHLDVEAQKAGARVAFHSGKKNISDFVLWRLTPVGEKRTMEWDSPWGKGQPGWHLECSAMAMKYLGATIDIHTGGIDHIPVHHTNEIAQSEAATGQRFANYWLHCAHLLSEGTKLSKSLGNSFTLSDIAQQDFSPMDLRIFLLQSHYRTETNFTFDNLAAAKNRLQRWRSVACLRHQVQTHPDAQAPSPHAALSEVIAALNDDLNTPEALRVIDAFFDTLEQTSLPHDQLTALLASIDDLLGLKLLDTTPDIDDETKQLLRERDEARAAKDWARSDELREQLEARHIIVNDTAHGSRWACQ